MRIGHVHLKVRNLDRSENFYRDLLGAEQTERVSSHYSFLTMGDAHHEIALQEIGNSAKSPTKDMVGLYHTAFEVLDVREFLGVIERLERLSIEHSLVDHGISWALYTTDPDGNGIEVYLDRRRSKDGKKLWAGISRALSKREIDIN